MFSCLDVLKESDRLNDRNIAKLTNRDFCSSEFFCGFSVLTEVPIVGKVSGDYYNDNSGHRRYYPNKFIIRGKAYIVTNHWYGPQKSNPDNRTPFMQWVMRQL